MVGRNKKKHKVEFTEYTLCMIYGVNILYVKLYLMLTLTYNYDHLTVAVWDIKEVKFIKLWNDWSEFWPHYGLTTSKLILSI